MIGENIKNARTAAGISQTDLAKKVGVSKQTLYKYETGIITNVPSDKIEEMSSVLHVTPARLMGWDEPSASDLQLTSFEIDLIKNYRSADAGTQAAVDKLLDLPGEEKRELSAG